MRHEIDPASGHRHYAEVCRPCNYLQSKTALRGPRTLPRPTLRGALAAEKSPASGKMTAEAGLPHVRWRSWGFLSV